MLNCAVIGLGHGASYLDLIRRHPGCTLTAVADQDEQRLAKIGDATPYRDALALIAEHRELDAVVIALPTAFHAEISIAALNAGKHVLLEKPLCRTDEEAAAIAEAVTASGCVFQLGYEVRSSPLHQTILAHVARGDIGELVNVWYNQHTFSKAGDSWRAQRSNMGGKLFDCSVHYLDLLQQWAGAPPANVFCMGNKMGEVGPCVDELPDSAVICVEYANGVRGTFNFNQVSRVNDDASFGLVGTTGRIFGNPWLPEGAGSFELRQDCGVRKSKVVFDGDLTSTGHLGFDEQWDNFVNAITNGGRNVCSIDDAVAVHRQMVAIDQSMATGQVIAI